MRLRLPMGVSVGAVLIALLSTSTSTTSDAFSTTPSSRSAWTTTRERAGKLSNMAEQPSRSLFSPGAFVPVPSNVPFFSIHSRSRSSSSSSSSSCVSSTSLFAKKNKKNAAKAPALETLEAIEAAEAAATTTANNSNNKNGASTAKQNAVDHDPFAAFDADEPLSKKEQMELEKKAKREAKKQQQQQKQQQPQPSQTPGGNSKKDARAAALAALEALEALEQGASPPSPSSKQQQQQQPPAALNFNLDEDDIIDVDDTTQLSKKELKKLAKKAARQKGGAVEMDDIAAVAAASASAAAPNVDTSPPQQQQQQQQQQDVSESKKKKQQQQQQKNKVKLEEDDDGVNGIVNEDDSAVNGDAIAVDSKDFISEETAEQPQKNKLTLEDKIRKERPPPRIRVMESSQPNYSALRLENVGITFRDQQVLRDVTWGVQTGDRIGLVGQNGAGKTTQLRILMGEMEPTTGDVVKSSKDLRVAMLRQEFIDELVPERTLMEEFMSVFEEENRILMDLRNAERELENMNPADDDDDHVSVMQEVLDRMQKLQAKADAKEVYALESRAKKIMDLMGFTTEEANDLVSMFSGGWKMRIGLGKVLLKDPNILLLDEPTNHLDLESVEWLEEFLKNQNIPMVIVSHDREFLDRVCTKIVDAEGGICSEYDGNYSRFLQLKKARMDAWHAAYNAQEKKIKEEKAWINKFKAKQPDAVKQRQAKLDKLVNSKDYVKKPPFFGKPFRFRFPDAPRISPEVAVVKGLSHAYSNGDTVNRLFEDCELFIEKGDRIAILGPNGSGKSTLLRILMGKEEPDEGTAEIVGQNVVANYFEQNQADALDLSKTVVETVQAASNGQSYNELRALLGQFLFKGDAVEKKVENLSGGEKARLSLCCMMLRPANLLILDEPTNHLDIPAKEMLEEALQHFEGSVVVVSHDRYFISKVANTIVAIEDKKLTKYQGDYKFYLEKSEHIKEKVESRYVNGVPRIESAPKIDLEELQKDNKKKNFGGAKTANLVTRKDKGIKNAKRMKG